MKKKSDNRDDVDNELLLKGEAAAGDFDVEAALEVRPQPKLNKLIAIRMPVEMIQRLKEVAAQKKVLSYQQLIKTYVAIGLDSEPKHTSHQLTVWFGNQLTSMTSGSPSQNIWQDTVRDNIPYDEQEPRIRQKY